MTLNIAPKTNAKPLPDAPLPDDRKAAVEYGLTQFNVMAAERDALRDQVRQLKSDLAGYKVALDAQQAQVSDMESRVATSTAIRDQAVADRAVYETLFISVQAQLRAFQIPHAPLIAEREPDEFREVDEAPTIGGA
jgi:hypothetical protein